MTEKKLVKTGFNPDEHMENIKGKPYLPVAWRLVWFREEHTDWGIETSVIDDREKLRATARAEIKDATGRIIATGHKTAKPRGMISDYVELAETGAIGRALAYCGYGTQFAPEILESEDEVVDAPVGEVREETESIVDTPKDTKKADFSLRGKQKTYFAVSAQAGFEGETAKSIAKKAYKVESFNDLTGVQLDNLIAQMSKKANAKKEETMTLDDIVEEYSK